MENQRQKDDVATPRGSTSPNETKGLGCQTGTTALTEPKGQFGEVANRLRGAAGGIAWVWGAFAFIGLISWSVQAFGAEFVGVWIAATFTAAGAYVGSLRR